MHHRKNNYLSVSVLLLSLFLIGIIFHNEDVRSLTRFTFQKIQSHEKPLSESNNNEQKSSKLSSTADAAAEDDEDMEHPPESCNIFDGKWVFDDLTRPLYKEDEYCNLPKFRGKLLVEKLKNKRLMFVGDSLNRNQWESMVCMVQSVASSGRKSLIRTGSLSIFRIEDYNATVEFYWAPYLVQSNSDDPELHNISDKIIMPKSINIHGQNWKNVDYLVFNTYIWWMNTENMKVS
ncbi:unnamed protein product [Lactuca virosa]|uniref:Trichome birefringence-like C-terminal domain-containing protein n=1 Tax=Lactuca virosa TaxID=75947 RepID=A0AAU9P5N4_9ASTR|nr:unnamed protein product [Lactuca virosa]